MKKQFATLFLIFIWIETSLSAFSLELNTSYDYFRGLPDGSWNGNSGAYVAGNLGACWYECLGMQLGGSFGLYNWDGRENLVFKNPKSLGQQAFLTTGLFFCLGQFNLGLDYDAQFVRHFGIYDVNTSLDQIRFQGGYQFYCEEVGIWGTCHITKAQETALGVPLAFKAINQINLFWSHFFENMAMTTIWIGAPYENSLRFCHKTAGSFISGFCFRAPLNNCLLIDAHGTYMWARESSCAKQNRNYAANLCIGITYLFGDICSAYGATYMPIANNANFLVDTNINQ